MPPCRTPSYQYPRSRLRNRVIAYSTHSKRSERAKNIMRRKQAKPHTKPRAQEYLYAIANEVTGLELVRTVWAYSLAEARSKVETLARCFGKSTQVIHIERT